MAKMTPYFKKTNQLSFTDIFHRRDEKYRARTQDHHDNRLLYRTRENNHGLHTLYMHIGDLVMKKAGLQAGDRVRILTADETPYVLAIKKDDHGIKLTPKSLSGDPYHAAMGTIVTCMLQLVIKPVDRLPLTTAGDNVPTEWNVQDGIIILTLNQHDVSIRHLLETDK